MHPYRVLKAKPRPLGRGFGATLLKTIYDGFVKSPTPALRCISQSFNVRSVRLMIAKFARLEFELFTRPSIYNVPLI